MQISIDALLRTSAIHQNLSMNSKEIKSGNDTNSPTESNAWDGKAYPIPIFGHIEFLEIDSKNMFISLLQIADFIKARKMIKGKTTDIAKL